METVKFGEESTSVGIELTQSRRRNGVIEIPTSLMPLSVPILRVDIVAHSRATGRFLCIDIKRSALDANAEREQRALLEAASVAALRFFRRTDLVITETKVVTLRWTAADLAASGGILNRETVDASLDAPVREAVDFGLATFRGEFDRLLGLLVDRMNMRAAAESGAKRVKRSTPALDPEPAAPLSLGDAWKQATRAGRFS